MLVVPEVSTSIYTSVFSKIIKGIAILFNVHLFLVRGVFTETLFFY